jgi:hypothetical protein
MREEDSQPSQVICAKRRAYFAVGIDHPYYQESLIAARALRAAVPRRK